MSIFLYCFVNFVKICRVVQKCMLDNVTGMIYYSGKVRCSTKFVFCTLWDMAYLCWVPFNTIQLTDYRFFIFWDGWLLVACCYTDTLCIITDTVEQGFDNRDLTVLYYCGAVLTLFALCSNLLAWGWAPTQRILLSMQNLLLLGHFCVVFARERYLVSLLRVVEMKLWLIWYAGCKLSWAGFNVPPNTL